MLLLALLHSAQWHNNDLGLLRSSQASLRISRRQSMSPKNNSSELALNQDPGHFPSQKSLLKQSRSISRPFEILYLSHPSSQKSPMPKRLDYRDFHNYKTASYIEIEDAIRSGRSKTNCASSPVSVAPAVTHVDNLNVRRTGSLMSKSPTLRRRNTFRNRNRMQKRSASPQKDNLSSLFFSGQSKAKKSRNRTSKLSFVFPIKRRTSYKYFPVSRALPKERKFTSQQDIDDYFVNGNILALMKDVIPRTMAVYDFKHPTHMRPKLISQPCKFAISRDARFTLLEREPSIALADKIPLKGEKLVESASSATNGTNHNDDASSGNSLLAKRRTFLNAVQTKYRAVVFAEGGKLPQKVQDAFPFEGDMMTEEEKESMNTQILLEILLRRTVAAKVEFRLMQNRASIPRRRKKAWSSSSRSTNPSESSSSYGASNTSDSSSSYGASNKKHKHIEGVKHSRLQIDSSNENASSMSNDELTQQSASMLSELLPSPQISFSSNMLAIDFLHSSPQNVGLRAASSGSKKDNDSCISHLSLDQLRARAENRTSSNEPESVNYVHEISKVDSFARQTPRPVSFPLGNVNDNSLRPLKGSNHTISSYSLESLEYLAHFDSASITSPYDPERKFSILSGDTTRYTENSFYRTFDHGKSPLIRNELVTDHWVK